VSTPAPTPAPTPASARKSTARYDALIVGGGFYGARLALMLRRRFDRVLLVEREAILLGRASLNNQARVHGGYHYPRSILTSLRSRHNYPRFVDEYGDCIDRSFPHYYAVARGVSKVTGNQFAEFCRRIEAPLSKAPAAVARLFDSTRVDAVFEVQECAFDAVKLRERTSRELVDTGVEVRTSTEAVSVRNAPDGARVTLRHAGAESEVLSSLVLNCTYSRGNQLLEHSAAARIPMKHELTEMAIVHPPDELQGAAVTVMDGPFFSLMPYPPRGLFSLSHVRYTPHCSWDDNRSAEQALACAQSRFSHMAHDAARYLPCMRNTRYVDSLWEIKTVMPRSEQDDSRPILFRRSAELPAVITVLGAKIDSVYDVEDALAQAHSS